MGRSDIQNQYLGCLGLLSECSPYVPEELREMIGLAMNDACAVIPTLRWHRVANRLQIEVQFPS